MTYSTDEPSSSISDQFVTERYDERRTRLHECLREAFIAGAEEDSRRCLGRRLTAKESERALRHYPGDVLGPREP